MEEENPSDLGLLVKVLIKNIFEGQKCGNLPVQQRVMSRMNTMEIVKLLGISISIYFQC